MALIQTSLIWVTYAVAVVLLLAIAAIFVYTYQTPRDRAASVTIVCIFTLGALLATVLLLPVDVALVSSTVSSKNGVKKDWATPERVNSILSTLKIVYYTLYSLDALLCLLVVPFTYFFYEEYDERETDEGTQTVGARLWGAFKYTVIFILIVIILFLVGYFVPAARYEKDKHRDFDYFKDLLTENREWPSPLTLHSANPFLCGRRRARPYVCSRSSHNPRNRHLRPLHSIWPCLTARHID